MLPIFARHGYKRREALALPCWEFWSFLESCQELEALQQLELINVHSLGSGMMSEENRKSSLQELSRKAGEHKWKRSQVKKQVSESNWMDDLMKVAGKSG